MSTRTTIAGPVLALALAAGALPAAAADVTPDPSYQGNAPGAKYTPPEGSMSVGRQQGGPSGDALARPGDPNKPAQGPSTPGTDTTRRGNAAANVETPAGTMTPKAGGSEIKGPVAEGIPPGAKEVTKEKPAGIDPADRNKRAAAKNTPGETDVGGPKPPQRTTK